MKACITLNTVICYPACIHTPRHLEVLELTNAVGNVRRKVMGTTASQTRTPPVSTTGAEQTNDRHQSLRPLFAAVAGWQLRPILATDRGRSTGILMSAAPGAWVGDPASLFLSCAPPRSPSQLRKQHSSLSQHATLKRRTKTAEQTQTS